MKSEGRVSWGNDCLILSMVASGDSHKAVCLDSIWGLYNTANATSQAAGASWQWSPEDWRIGDCGRGGSYHWQSWGFISGRIAQWFRSPVARNLLTRTCLRTTCFWLTYFWPTCLWPTCLWLIYFAK